MPGSRGKKSSKRVPVKTPHLTRIAINVYDLLPQGRFSTLLWNVGTSLVHSGVVIGDKEYAFGAHLRHGVTGVYFTRPGLEPPGATFRCEIVQGFSLRTPEEIDAIIFEASHAFLGPSWNLLGNNCNHFTSYLCRELTGRPGPAWLNRAASIGMCMPCLIPREWVEPPDANSAKGRLLDQANQSRPADVTSSADEDDESTAMLGKRGMEASSHHADDVEYDQYQMSDADIQGLSEDELDASWRRKRRQYRTGLGSAMTDNAGRQIPAAERAPLPAAPR